MCDAIYYYKEFAFYCAFITGVCTVIYMSRYARKKGIDFNSVFGLLEVYRLVFAFKNKKLSVVVLLVMYGNALLLLIAFALHYWGMSEGCVFKLSGKWADN
ncbi:hypothetical protein N5F23_07770 [Pseudomonas sichuanensis]|uniref:hypothetical protein n=1 Tax=Pseudomonas sichuanensis TaxID=2213015 RepID=UPI002447D801|nr:hypothetical protein [Pseudomonas sichuanensis]MDH0729789.1 hypothetical protein [Pseudomonas sichuanensis]MDH1582489.1 hypothetical protein [Pseudomonas sichuanensis]MDH1593944.1 hypothetical protein [Pseudomonas sichuanensis]MDH1597482.1 hypothetical protein [Pseudomonas sichuanensis]